jgi:hypothetical protein
VPVYGGSLLVDANVIIEAHDKGCWTALIERYRVETVRQCVIETQTGIQGRPVDQQIDQRALEASLYAIHEVSDLQRASLSLLGGPFLDDGERNLWAYAIDSPQDRDWKLCGPDKASMKMGYQQGRRSRLISLGELLADIGHRPARPLKSQFEKQWLDRLLSDLLLGIMR